MAKCTIDVTKLTLINVQNSFHQQMHPLLNMQNVKNLQFKYLCIRSYMFRSIWTILRELTLSLAKG
jgi:hypothetical protein